MRARFIPLWIPNLAALVLPFAFPIGLLRADQIQSFQSPENVIGQAQFTVGVAGHPATASNLYSPQGIAVDPVSGKLFIADTLNNRVLRFASAAAQANGAAAEAVLGQPDFVSSGSATTPKEMTKPIGLAFDSTGRLWVADSGNNRVLRFDNAATKANFSANADGVLGQVNLSSKAAPSPPTQASMFIPTGLAVDGNGTLWVSDSLNYRLLRFDNAAAKANGANADGVLGSPTFTTTIAFVTAQYSVSRPEGLAIDSSGTLWVADNPNHRVLRFDQANSKPNGALADGVLGQPVFDTNIPYSPPSASTLINPWGVAVDSTGALWVTDFGNSRVLRFDHAAAKANGGAADLVLGQKTFTAKIDATSRTGLDHPAGIALAASGDLFLTETQNHRALRYTPKPDPIVPPPIVAPPTLAVAGKKIVKTTKSNLLFKGSASSTDGIARVEYRVGTGAYHPAAGTKTWHFTAHLKPGKNTLTIRAVSNGKQSSQLVLHVTRD